MKRICALCILATVALAGGESLLAQELRTRAATPDLPAGPEAVTSRALVPRFIKFSGTLVDLAGKPMVGVTDVTFALYSDEGGGTALWYETQTIEADALGRYTVLLGVMHASGVPLELFTTGEAKWLGIGAGNLPESAQGGRVLLVSVPYALKAVDAETLGGKPASAYMLAPSESEMPAVGPTSPAGPEAPKSNVVGKVGKRQLKPLVANPATNFVDNNGSQVVFIQQNGTGYGLNVSSASNYGIYSQELATSGLTHGVVGVGHSVSGAGVFGINMATTGTAPGVWGVSNSPTGAALYGTNGSTATGLALGVYGQTSNPGGIGLFGRATSATGVTSGIGGRSDSTNGIGVNAQASATTGATMGLIAKVYSVNGTAAIFDNTAGGKLLSGQSNGIEKFNLTGAGSGYFAGVVNIGTTSGGAGDLLTVNGPMSASTYNTPSSIRWKSDVETIEGAMEKVEDLRGVTYDWMATGQHQMGFIAEEVAGVVPEVVTYDKDHLPAGLDYSRLSALLVEAVKTQQAEIKSQQEEINQLKVEVQQLKTRGKKTRKTVAH